MTDPCRVLVLNANSTMSPYRVAPLGLALLASAKRAAGHEVRFLDLPRSRAARRRFRRLLTDWPADYLAVGIRNLDNSDFHGFESYLTEPAPSSGSWTRGNSPRRACTNECLS